MDGKHIDLSYWAKVACVEHPFYKLFMYLYTVEIVGYFFPKSCKNIEYMHSNQANLKI